MTDDPGSLDKLRDLAMPPQVALLPLAPGIVILALGLIAVAAILAWRAVATYRQNAYRRAALAEIDAIAAGVGDPVVAIFAVLKRTAMVGMGRERVAPLTGEALGSFLADHGPGFERTLIHDLARRAYDGANAARPEEISAFAAQARTWVRKGGGGAGFDNAR